MNLPTDLELPPEPERYEFWENFGLPQRPGRRDFFKIVGSGVVVALLVPKV